MSKQNIYNILTSAGMTPYGACAMMGNMQAESNLKSNIAQRGMTKLTDEEYTAAADAGTIDFVHDKVGYGLIQLTHYKRKENYLNFAKSLGVSVGDETAQVQFVVKELQMEYATLWKYLCSTENMSTAASKICTEYERPAVNNTSVRANYAKSLYNELAETKHETENVADMKGVASMVFDVNKVIAVAEEEVGYLEKKSNLLLDNKTLNKGANNFTKYARDLDNIPGFYNGKKQGFAYCDQFVDWCFVKAYGVDAALYLLCQPMKSAGAGCQYSAQYFKNKSQFYTSNPQVGDQIFFGSASSCNHTGLVYKVDGNAVYTIEGNVNGGNGEGVYKKSYPLGSGAIYGYGRPNYAKAAPAPAAPAAPAAQAPAAPKVTVNINTCNVVLSELRTGCMGMEVENLQCILIKNGYNCGADGADGDFGENTRNAVMKFQKNSGLTADGICGQKTWEKLLKG